MDDATRTANTLAGLHTGGWEGRAGDWDPRHARQRPSLTDRFRTVQRVFFGDVNAAPSRRSTMASPSAPARSKVMI